MVKPYFDRPSGQVQQDISMFSGGINTYIDKAFIEDNQMPFVVNMTMRRPPMMETRPGRLDLGLFEYMSTHWTIGGHQDGPYVKYNMSVKAMYAYKDKEIYVLATSDNWTIGNPVRVIKFTQTNGAWTHDDIGGLPLVDDYYFCYAKDETNEYLYITSSTFKARVLLSGFTIGQQEFEIISDGHYGIPAWHKGRLFLGSPNSGIVTYSALMDYDNFTPVPEGTDPLDIDYSSYAGDFFVTNGKGMITGLKSFDDKLVIFCEHSMHLLYGDTPLISSSSQFQLVDMDNDLGAISPRCIDTGGGRLYWLGDDFQVYEYTGSSLRMVSRPINDRYSASSGGVDGILPTDPAVAKKNMQFIATYDKLFINLPYTIGAEKAEYLLVYDIYNRVWWVEDGEFVAMAEYNTAMNQLIVATEGGHVILTQTGYGAGVDQVFVDGVLTDIPIKYMFQTKVYGANSVSGTKTISEVWFQARANAKVYLNDVWTSLNLWHYDGSQEDPYVIPNTSMEDERLDGFKEIGELRYELQYPQGKTQKYLPLNYENQPLYVEKMFGQRLNAFSLIVKGENQAEFYLMQRKWRINENV